jgi:hypothetical protein
VLAGNSPKQLWILLSVVLLGCHCPDQNSHTEHLPCSKCVEGARKDEVLHPDVEVRPEPIDSHLVCSSSQYICTIQFNLKYEWIMLPHQQKKNDATSAKIKRQ